MTDVAASVDVRVPLRTAYNQWTQFGSFPVFMAGVVAVWQLDDRSTHWITEVAGARREFDAEIVEQRPDERIAWRSTDGDLRHSGAVTFESISARETRVTVDLAWQPRGMVEKAGGTLGIGQLQVKADLRRFKRFIEELGSETGQWRGRIAAGNGDNDRAQTQTAAQTSAPAPAPLPTQESAETHPAAGPESFDIVDVLLRQHELLMRKFSQTAEASGPAKERHLTGLLLLLEAHEKGEQQVVRPVTRTTGDLGDRAAENRLTEERELDEFIANLRRAIVGTPEFDARFARLRGAVLRHADREENDEFPRLRREVAPGRLREMAQELIALQGGTD